MRFRVRVWVRVRVKVWVFGLGVGVGLGFAWSVSKQSVEIATRTSLRAGSCVARFSQCWREARLRVVHSHETW